MFLRRLPATLELSANVSVIAVAISLLVQPWLRPAGTASSVAEEIRPIRIDGRQLTNRLGDAHQIIVEFGDFECPYCAQNAKTTLPALRKELVEKGAVSYAYMHFPIEPGHRNAFKASEAAECAGEQGQYWQMHEVLFSNQRDLAPASLVAYARSLNIDTTAFAQCLDGQMAERVRASKAEGQRLGVTATPASFIGQVQPDGSVELTRVVRGAAPFETMRHIVSSLSERAPWWKPRWLQAGN